MAVRVGVVGAGIMGADHANTLHRYVSGATVSMVADVDMGRARAAADAIGARVTDDAFALIDDPSVDAVVIASHDSTHADQTIAAIRAGKPVMCEKPLAPTVDECLRVVRAEATAGGARLVSVGFMRRFDPAYRELKAALRDGVCGTPLLMHCVSRGVHSAAGSTSESSIVGSAIHEFDVVPWLLDAPITEVGWHAPRSSPGVTGLQDPQLILLRTADGVLADVEVFLNARYGYDMRTEIVGDRGTVALTNPVHVITDSERRRSTGYPADWRPRFADAYRLELQGWIDAVVAGEEPPLPTAQDGLTSMVVAEAVIASMNNGGAVTGVRTRTA